MLYAHVLHLSGEVSFRSLEYHNHVLSQCNQTKQMRAESLKVFLIKDKNSATKCQGGLLQKKIMWMFQERKKVKCLQICTWNVSNYPRHRMKNCEFSSISKLIAQQCCLHDVRSRLERKDFWNDHSTHFLILHPSNPGELLNNKLGHNFKSML